MSDRATFTQAGPAANDTKPTFGSDWRKGAIGPLQTIVDL
jgi:hypothetical protein